MTIRYTNSLSIQYWFTACSPALFASESVASGNVTSAFEALRETVYAEVATLISQNEACPHYLVELFRQLQMLSTDFLRQRGLFAIQDIVARYFAKVCHCVHLYKAHHLRNSPNALCVLVPCKHGLGARKQLRRSSYCGQGPEDCSRRTDQQWQKPGGRTC